MLIDLKETKYLIFKKEKLDKKKTYDINIYNKSREFLGRIHWRSGWRTYVVSFQPDIDFDIKCMDDIISYIKALLEERKANL